MLDGVTAARLGYGAAASAALALLAVAPAYLGYHAGPFAPLVLAAGGAFTVLAMFHPGWALPVACLLAPLEGVQVPLGGLGALSPTEAAFLVLAAGWCWRALATPDRVCFPGIADFPTVAFVLAVLPGATIGADPRVVARLGLMWTAFFLVHLTVRELAPHEVRRVLWALGIGAGLLGLTGLLNYVAGGGAVVAQGGAAVSGRASGGIDDPNYFSAYLQLAAVPLLGLAVGRLARPRALAFAVFGAAAAGVVLSLSRGGTLGLALAVGIVVMSWSRTRWVSVAVAAALAVTTVASLNPLLKADVTETVAERLSSATQQSSNNKRLLIWEKSVGVVLDHPAFGVGALEFEREANRLNLTQNGQPLQNVHNVPLNIAVELGLLGLVAYLLWLARVVRDLVAEGRRRRPHTFPLVVGAGAALAGYLLQGLTVSQYQVQVVHAAFFVVTGVAAAVRTWPDELGRAGLATAEQPAAG